MRLKRGAVGAYGAAFVPAGDACELGELAGRARGAWGWGRVGEGAAPFHVSPPPRGGKWATPRRKIVCKSQKLMISSAGRAKTALIDHC